MDYLAHHGIKGQKHGVRRWQNKDGSLTPEGYPHYGYNGPRNKINKNIQGHLINNAYKKAYDASRKKDSLYNQSRESLKRQRKLSSQVANSLQEYKDASNKLVSKAKDKNRTIRQQLVLGYDDEENKNFKNAKNTYNKTYEEYNGLTFDIIKKEAQSYEYKKLANKNFDRAEKLINKFADKYGQDEYNKLFEKYEDLKQYQSIKHDKL